MPMALQWVCHICDMGQQQTTQCALHLKITKLKMLPCLAMQCYLHIQFNINTIMILSLDKAMIPLEGASGDHYSLPLPNVTVLGLKQSSSLDTRYRYLVYIDIDLNLS